MQCKRCATACYKVITVFFILGIKLLNIIYGDTVQLPETLWAWYFYRGNDWISFFIAANQEERKYYYNTYFQMYIDRFHFFGS